MADISAAAAMLDISVTARDSVRYFSDALWRVCTARLLRVRPRELWAVEPFRLVERRQCGATVHPIDAIAGEEASAGAGVLPSSRRQLIHSLIRLNQRIFRCGTPELGPNWV
ncbi:unnamed protein product, partial [Iphiclides podalirius]